MASVFLFFVGEGAGAGARFDNYCVGRDEEGNGKNIALRGGECEVCGGFSW